MAQTKLRLEQIETINAADIVNVPAGGIAATDVQAAIDELDSEKMGAGEIGEGHITILPPSYNSIGQGTWVIGLTAGFFLNGYLRNTTTADGDNILFKVYLDAGTYTLLILGFKGTDQGIIDVDIDAVEIASFDMYAGAPTVDQRLVDVGNVIATPGLKTLKVRLDGKNALSTDFIATIQYIALWRTA